MVTFKSRHSGLAPTRLRVRFLPWVCVCIEFAWSPCACLGFIQVIRFSFKNIMCMCPCDRLIPHPGCPRVRWDIDPRPPGTLNRISGRESKGVGVAFNFGCLLRYKQLFLYQLIIFSFLKVMRQKQQRIGFTKHQCPNYSDKVLLNENISIPITLL